MYWYQPMGYYPQDVSSSYGYGPSRTYAVIEGGPLAPNIHGYVLFEDVPYGTEVYVEVSGLPPYKPATGNQQPIGPFGFHLHEKGVCTIGNPKEPFQAAGEHWNPTNQPHGNHVSDFPVLVASDGYARMSFFTNKFRAADVIGRAVMIHQNPDDYRTQPAGNAGKRLACGVIQAG